MTSTGGLRIVGGHGGLLHQTAGGTGDLLPAIPGSPGEHGEPWPQAQGYSVAGSPAAYSLRGSCFMRWGRCRTPLKYLMRRRGHMRWAWSGARRARLLPALTRLGRPHPPAQPRCKFAPACDVRNMFVPAHWRFPVVPCEAQGRLPSMEHGPLWAALFHATGWLRPH